MPVEMITGLPLLATYSISGQKLLSPEAIFHTGTIGARNRALSRSSGVEKKITPRSWASSASRAN